MTAIAVPFPITELALTLGAWGQPPPDDALRRRVLEVFAGWAESTGAKVRLEHYLWAPSFDTVKQWVERAHETGIVPVVRLEPHSDRFKLAAELGFRETVIEVPVSPQAAGVRFLAKGTERAPEYAARAARDAALAGVTPEIALVDVTRATREVVLAVVERVLDELRPRQVTPRWRLVDSTGAGDPLSGARLPRALSRWIALLASTLGIPGETIAIQCADTLGLGNANALSGYRAGGCAATSLFGLGAGAGWAATEVVATHRLGKPAKLRGLLELVPELTDPSQRDPHRPVSGARAYQFPGGTSPEAPGGERLSAWFFQDTEVAHAPEPLLTSLSGHAGLLHLMHRAWPDRHFDSEDVRAHAISAEFENQFAEGRPWPVSWSELEAKVRASGLLD